MTIHQKISKGPLLLNGHRCPVGFRNVMRTLPGWNPG